MKKCYPFLFMILFIYGCVTFNRYEVVTSKSLPLYGPEGLSDTRYEDIVIGDTLVVYGKDIIAPKSVHYKSTPIWTTGLWTGSKQISKRKLTRKQSKAISAMVIPKTYDGVFLTYESHIEQGEPVPMPASRSYLSPSGPSIHAGPRGGKYYINSNGNKSYIKKGSSTPTKSGPSYRRK